MGLFKFLRKKGPSHDDKLRIAYRCFKPEAVESIFPGGIKQADRIVSSLGKIYNIDLESCDFERYYEILNTYLEVLIRRKITSGSNAHIIKVLQVKHPDLVNNKEIATNALAFITINMRNNNFALKTDDDMAKLSLVIKTLTYAEDATKQNVVAETENLEDPEYGLVLIKPIYTQGVSGSNKYLQELETTLGEPLTWNRRGAAYVEGINGMVDVYDSFLPSGKPYKTLYLNMYGSTNSAKIPVGFKKV